MDVRTMKILINGGNKFRLKTVTGNVLNCVGRVIFGFIRCPRTNYQ